MTAEALIAEAREAGIKIEEGTQPGQWWIREMGLHVDTWGVLLLSNASGQGGPVLEVSDLWMVLRDPEGAFRMLGNRSLSRERYIKMLESRIRDLELEASAAREAGQGGGE